ncbi:unnamed protein product [Aspergillus oryzae]|uniref:Unnamed protein product n=1 Tax=Aspergillus oryzae var. brunneus TaxID=332754 RepID=A0ABQ6LDE2_ASPOZ|nr:unnamed protein product [Aspergillus oryzae]GMF95951.1 unnamed protein product [Aspergillus oryzae]GMG54875.1 unnamed protein product [Aspergillus oryzae var. brunneus]
MAGSEQTKLPSASSAQSELPQTGQEETASSQDQQDPRNQDRQKQHRKGRTRRELSEEESIYVSELQLRFLRPARTCQFIRRACGCFSRLSKKPSRGIVLGRESYQVYANATSRIYNESECEMTREEGLYIFTYWLVWILVIIQLMVSAVITAFTASNDQNLNHIPVAVLGGVNFLLTSLLGFLRVEPERRWQNAAEYRRVIGLVDGTIDWLRYADPTTPLQPLVKDAESAIEAARRNVAANRPADFVRVSSGQTEPDDSNRATE